MIDGKSIGRIRRQRRRRGDTNSKITWFGGGYAVCWGIYFSGTPLLIEDSEIDCADTNGTALGEDHRPPREHPRLVNGGDINQNFIVEDSYIHDMFNSAAAHTYGLQFAAHFENGKIVRQPNRHIILAIKRSSGIGADGSFGTSWRSSPTPAATRTS